MTSPLVSASVLQSGACRSHSLLYLGNQYRAGPSFSPLAFSSLQNRPYERARVDGRLSNVLSDRTSQISFAIEKRGFLLMELKPYNGKRRLAAEARGSGGDTGSWLFKSISVVFSLILGILAPSLKLPSILLSIFTNGNTILKEVKEDADKAAEIVKEAAQVIEEVAEGVETVSKLIEEGAEKVEAQTEKNSSAIGIIENFAENVEKASKRIIEDAEDVEALMEKVETTTETIHGGIDEVLDTLIAATQSIE